MEMSLLAGELGNNSNDISLLFLPNDVLGVILLDLTWRERFWRFGLVNRRFRSLSFMAPFPTLSFLSDGLIGEKFIQLTSEVSRLARHLAALSSEEVAHRISK